MTFDDVVQHYGSVPAAAEALEMTDKGIYKWKKEPIEGKRQCMIELSTKGALKADPSAYTST